MEKLKIVSWNVNGVRAVQKKEALKWIDQQEIDILGLQETKCQIDQIPTDLFNKQYKNQVSSQSEIKGRSGTTLYADLDLIRTSTTEHIDILNEGRINEIEFEFDNKQVVLFNVYFPNGQSKEDRLTYKMEFYERFYEYCKKLLNEGKSVILFGDVNTAHTSIDLSKPEKNENVSGFLPMERDWMTKFIELGFIDTFRYVNGDVKNKYTWWSYRYNERQRNIGWRIDYIFVSKDLEKYIKKASILNEVMGSDHCPIILELQK